MGQAAAILDRDQIAHFLIKLGIYVQDTILY